MKKNPVTIDHNQNWQQENTVHIIHPKSILGFYPSMKGHVVLMYVLWLRSKSAWSAWNISNFQKIMKSVEA